MQSFEQTHTVDKTSKLCHTRLTLTWAQLLLRRICRDLFKQTSNRSGGETRNFSLRQVSSTKHLQTHTNTAALCKPYGSLEKLSRPCCNQSYGQAAQLPEECRRRPLWSKKYCWFLRKWAPEPLRIPHSWLIILNIFNACAQNSETLGVPQNYTWPNAQLRSSKCIPSRQETDCFRQGRKSIELAQLGLNDQSTLSLGWLRQKSKTELQVMVKLYNSTVLCNLQDLFILALVGVASNVYWCWKPNTTCQVITFLWCRSVCIRGSANTKQELLVLQQKIWNLTLSCVKSFAV
jgi:hypothetical protein